MHTKIHSAKASPLSIVTALVDKIGKQYYFLWILRILSNHKRLLKLEEIFLFYGKIFMYAYENVSWYILKYIFIKRIFEWKGFA